MRYQNCFSTTAAWKKKKRGHTGIRTQITGFRVLGANPYTIRPRTDPGLCSDARWVYQSLNEALFALSQTFFHKEKTGLAHFCPLCFLLLLLLFSFLFQRKAARLFKFTYLFIYLLVFFNFFGKNVYPHIRTYLRRKRCCSMLEASPTHKSY